ncbi:phosphatidylserine decarboxylase [Desertibacillus haloalkaliphilus]|uniref:phosphatidylserine decarboxylase n=1 Tax=Desertibacillus haloalkaliphilus TaxID=1328930 RepID=UPI001C257D30|nr:phosphatidylserine decarboxylase [Desertibacillus haloalkaliphilus]MBU8905595.1 phosphatidylserine decarboxylase [Desertibacillus haloalkaliphilus]
MKKVLYQWCIELTSNRFTSFLLKAFTSSRLSRFVNRSFVRTYNINTDEMEKPLHEYKSLQELFVRKLKPDVREIDLRKGHVVSPVDGVIAFTGTLTGDQSFYVKGQKYSLRELLGSEQKCNRYKNGSYAIFYLSPSHYHRIHSPVTGSVVDQWLLGKKSYPVNDMGLIYGKRPLSKNYRLITEIKSGGKHVAVVKVGALNVNSIHTTYSTEQLEKGEEMAYFSFGSTVILLFEGDFFRFGDSLTVPSDIRVGNSIGITEER